MSYYSPVSSINPLHVEYQMENEPLYKTMLFDFFGELLTEKQREYFDLYHNEDLSLSEIDEKAGISRQGVYDIITRAEKSLIEMERKTGVVQRWLDTRAQLQKAESIAHELIRLTGGRGDSAELANKLMTVLGNLTD